jgi:hypothetical protein
MPSIAEGKRKSLNMAKIEACKKLDERQRKQLQHELKVYMEQYMKKKLGRSCFTLAWPREASLYPPGQAIMPVFQA